MKKIICMVATLAMVLSLFGNVALAANSITYTLSTDKDTYNAGDQIELLIEGDTKCGNFGLIVDFDEDLFEVVDSDPGNHSGALEMNPSGAANCFSIGGMNTRDKNVEAYVWIKVKDTAASGTFTFNAVSVGAKNNTLADETPLAVEVEPCTITIVGAAPAGPNWNKIDATVETFESDKNAEAGYAYGVNYTCADAAAMIFAAGADEARLYSNEIDVTGTEGAVNVGFLSDVALENVGVLFRDADKANIWYSLDVDKH